MSVQPDARDAGGHPGAPHLLEVRDLTVEFRTPRGVVNAVNGISYTLDRHETLAILGESGSGKSVSAQALMGLIDSPPGFVTDGEILFQGVDQLTESSAQRRRVRGDGIAMIFQDALSALNPVFSVGWQIGEMFRVHRGTSRREATKKAVELMDRVGIPSAAQRVGDYPHEFSGGMRQRVMIAMALALDPDILIADEPTTALDVTVQAQVMDLLAELQAETGMGLILITHDLGVVADVAHKVAVMYAGRLVETGPVDVVYPNPAHPYTLGLMGSLPRVDQKGSTLTPIPGAPPSLMRIPSGCPFHPRCAFVRDDCRTDPPPLYDVAPGRHAACHYTDEVLRER
jgi:oligopeptide transport system ATP-binding protein